MLLNNAFRSLLSELMNKQEKYYTVTVLPAGDTISCSPDALLLDVLEDGGYPVSAPCGGRGRCGKCGIRAEGALSPVSRAEEELLHDRSLRLSCMARVQGDVVVDMPKDEAVLHLPSLELDRAAAYCIAVDIGTTVVKTSLVNTESRERFPLASFLNPQRRFGHDVISRIAAASDPASARKMSGLLRNELKRLVRAVMGRYSLSEKNISTMVFSGNTTMMYLLLGLDCAPLGAHPYRAAVLDFDDGMKGLPVESGINPETELLALPAASAFLGGDLVGGLALVHEQGIRERAFFIDIGTNGEMFLLDARGDVFATSCAMGPALEGMNISCGMTAADGAVDHVRFDQGRFICSVIGQKEPVGISGTGLIDAIAVMLGLGVIDRDGSFSGDQSSAAGAYDPGARVIRLAERVSVSQKDIRQVQLAKGASLAAAQILVRESGMPAEDIKDVFIAGAFGEHLDLDNFRLLSFLPAFPEARWHFLGNTSLAAAEAYCCDDAFRRLARQLRDRIRIIELSSRQDFNDLFLASLDF